MTKMRVRPGYLVSTRAHSALRASVLGAPPRRPLSSSDYYYPQRTFPSAYDPRSEEFSISDSVLRATYHSDAVLDDTYDTSAKSRSRDKRLLSDATNAIPPSLLEPVKARRTRTGYKPLSRRSRNYPVAKTMDTSPSSLPTSTLTASPRPVPSLPSSLLKYSSKFRGVTSIPIGVRRFTGLQARAPLFEYEPDDKPTASMAPSPRLLGGYVSPRIVSRRYQSVLRGGQTPLSYSYPPGSLASSHLLGGYVSPKMASAHHDIARARTALSSLLRTYDDASLLMRVEGDAHSQHHDGKLGFRYYHPPVSIKGSGVDSRHLRLSPLMQDQDDFLGDYIAKTRSLQNDVRRNLLKDASTAHMDVGPYSYEQRLRLMPIKIGSTKHVVPVTTFRRRLAGGLRHRLDVFHLPLVEKMLPESSHQLMLTPSQEPPSRGGHANLSPLKLSVLDKIKIKVSSESHASPGSAVASRRARTRPQTAPRLASIHVVSKVAAVSPPASSLDHPKARLYDRKRIILVVSSVKGRVPTRVVGAKPTGLVIPPTVVDKITAIKASVRYMTRRTAPSPTRAWPIYTAAPVAARRRTMLSTSRASRMPYFVARSRFVTRSPLNTVLHPYALRKSRKRAKAALVASKVEVEPRRRRRMPHSQYAADKLRETRRPGDQDSYVPATINTSTLHASRPPIPLPSERKAIRDVDGFTKPRNILSWQYRLEARVNPSEVMYTPGVYNRMRVQVRDAHDKLDRHRQLLDRYLNETGGANIQRYIKTAEMDEGSQQSRGRSSSAPPAPTQPAMSELRRRLRKTICKSKRDPNYYRE